MKALSAAPLLLSLLLALPVPAAEEGQEAKEPEHQDYRVFTARNGKTVEARVVARIDDERYRLETKDGNAFTLKIDTLSESDQQFLEFWEPDAILDFATATLPQVLAKMDYSSVPMTVAGNNQLVAASLGGTELRFVLAPSRNFSTLDPASASNLGLELVDGTLSLRDAQGNTERSKQATIASFTMGDVELDGLNLQVVEVAKLVNPVPANTVGILGSDVLEKLNALVDLGGKRLFVKEGK